METDLAKWVSSLPSPLAPPAAPPTTPPAPRRSVIHATHWPSTSFVLAAGTATFQPSRNKVLLVEDTARQQPYWFLPRGRKDVGETLEQCAIRETFEEVISPSPSSISSRLNFKAGYNTSLIRAPIFTRQPTPGTNEEFPAHSEAFHVQLKPLAPKRGSIHTTMYIAFWYLCVIPEDASRHPSYGLNFVGRHEAGYRSALVDIEHAVHLLSDGRFTYHPSDQVNFQGVVLDEEGREVVWENVEGGNNGGVQALIVARGWEHVRLEVRDEGGGQSEGKFTQSVFETDSNGEAERMGEVVEAGDGSGLTSSYSFSRF